VFLKRTNLSKRSISARTAIRQGKSNVLMHNADLPANDPRFLHLHDRFRGDGKELTVVQKLDAFLPQLRKER
jgi:hypothetical protein